MYLMGISAGAALGAKYTGLYGKEGIFKAYGSLSNPYNFARVSFHVENLFWGRIISKVINFGFKKKLNENLVNPVFKDLINQRKLSDMATEERFTKSETCWEFDSKFTYKLASKRLNPRFPRPVLVLLLQKL
jgi:predicted alpha/beta-fold hydrolase